MRRIQTATAVATAALLLIACGGSSDDSSTTTAPTTTAGTTTAPGGPPPSDATPATAATTVASGQTTAPTDATADVALAADIDEIVEASRDEGTLLIYGNPNDDQFAPLVEAFEAAYPWIDAQALSLGGPETMQRYLSEEATGARTADVIVNNEAPGWLDLVDRGQIVDYVDPRLAELPDYVQLAPGVVAMSFDPVIAIFNSAILPEDEQPTTLAELAAMAGELDGKIGTYDMESSTGYAANFYYLDATGEAGWDVIETLAPHARAENSGGTLVSKVVQGEYTAVYFMAGAARALSEGDAAAQVVNWRYLEDATPLVPRGVGVTTAAQSPNAAKLFVNFVLSTEGQTAGCAGGFTPYIAGTGCEFDLASIEAAVGADNLIIGNLDRATVTEHDEIVARWNTAFGR